MGSLFYMQFLEAFCSRKETIDHCFLNCACSKTYLFFPCSFLVSFLTVFLFSFSDGILCTLKMLVWHNTWLSQSYLQFGNSVFKATFHNGNEHSRAIIWYTMSDIHRKIASDHYRLSISSFTDAWESPVLCEVVIHWHGFTAHKS